MEEQKKEEVVVNQDFNKISIEEEMKKSYLEYAMSVIVGRALPDVRDGLKPVHRRILFAMNEQNYDWNRPHRKSARVVGDVIGKYHPHGDTAVYDSIVRMAQYFSLRYPLIDGQGNFGSIDGDAPAAMRYTEVRFKKLTGKILEDIEKETVDFTPNYDGSLFEPKVLPTKIPNLLINGSSGIAVGMATNIPPHNLTEVCTAINALIDNPDITIDEIMEYIPAPDFPTYGEIYGKAGIVQAYKTGKGIIKIRAKVDIEENKNDQTIAISELPYQVNKAKLIERIAELIKDKTIEGITYVRDESDKKGLRVAIGVKKGNFAEIIVNQLFKHTNMQVSFGIILLTIVNNKPELLNLKRILEYFVIHRKEIIKKRTIFDLKNAEARAHILEGLKIAIDNLDAVVALIRKSKTPLEAKQGLIKNYSLTDLQAQAILDMRLQRLTGLELEKIIEEYGNILKAIIRYKEILADETEVLKIIKEETQALIEEFGDERKTRIVDSMADIDIEDMIAEENMVVSISLSGYIKRTPTSVYENQRRGGKGKIAMTLKDEDFVEKVFVASTHNTFLFFTNKGKVYWSKVYQIPEASRTSQGKAIVNFFAFEEGEKLTTILAVKNFEENKNIVMATRKGIIKKSKLIDYSRPRTGGIIAIKLQENDELVAVGLAKEGDSFLISSTIGKTIHFNESSVRLISRVAKGVKAMRFKKDAEVVSMEILDSKKDLFTATENGYGKRTHAEEFREQGRGGQGIISINTKDRNGLVIGASLVDNDDEIMLITNTGKLIRMKVSEISVLGRNTKGTKLINLEKGEKLISLVKLPKEELKND